MNKRDNRSDNTRRPDGQMEGNPEIDVQDSTINAGQEAQISDVEPMDGGDSDVSELEALKGLLDEKEKEVEKEKKEFLLVFNKEYGVRSAGKRAVVVFPPLGQLCVFVLLAE